MAIYPDAPGFKTGDTSLKAAKTVESKAITLRQRCFYLLKSQDMTADEAAECMGESLLAIRPRFSELRAQGLIRKSGQRRKNKSGCNAIVWTTRMERQADLI